MKIMGILNVTPDSFSDGGQYTNIEAAVAQAQRLVAEGADILDIGGESTRPGSAVVDEAEELRRVIPVIRAIAERVNVPISVDTYKAEVARQAVAAGATIINDVWGAKKDTKMAEVAAETGVPIVLMHNRPEAVYDSFLADVIRDLQESIQIAKLAGVKDEQIIVDPGIGFAKNFEHNIEIMKHLSLLKQVFPYPLLLGTSRKSMIGHILDVPPLERVEGTIATTCFGMMQGCDIVRVHDVQANKRAMMVMAAMMEGQHG